MNLPNVDFFAEANHQEKPRCDTLFGINDGVEEGDLKGCAYTTTDGEPTSWNAVVENKNAKEVCFLPLDHNIVIHPKPDETYSLCDGMLYHGSWVAFVELKVKKADWISENIAQLRSTIELFLANHDVKNYKYRFAYAANRKFPRFNTSHKREMQEFHQKTGFRLLIQNRITVKA